MTKIREDNFGLYAIIDGWICRVPANKRQISKGIKGPEIHWLEGTKFKTGDTVRGSHPPGPTAYLRIGKKNTQDYYAEPWEIVCLADETPEKKQELHKKREEEIKKYGDYSHRVII